MRGWKIRIWQTFGLCSHDICEKSNECKRYLYKDLPHINPIFFRFKNICDESNEYQWMIKVETSDLIPKEEGDA